MLRLRFFNRDHAERPRHFDDEFAHATCGPDIAPVDRALAGGLFCVSTLFIEFGSSVEISRRCSL